MIEHIFTDIAAAYVCFAVIWGVYAGRQQLSLYGWSYKVPLVFLVNTLLMPFCMWIALSRNKS